MSRAIYPGEYLQACEKVAEAAYEMCQWLDIYRADDKWGDNTLPPGMRRAADELHHSLEPWERIKYGGSEAREDV
jgi:hypothetical protein